MAHNHHNEHDEHHDGCCCSHNHEHEHNHCHEHEHEHEHECDHDHCGCHGHEHHGCGCHHHHEHGSVKKKLMLIVVTAILLGLAVLVEKTCNLATWQLLLVYLVPYLLIGYETLKEAAEGLAHGDAFNEHFLMSIATIGALGIGFLPGAETQFPEAVFVMLFFQVGEMFEGYAEGQSRKSIAHLMDIRPDVASVERNGEVITMSPANVAVGETIVIKPGEKIPLDGVVIEGSTSLNTVALQSKSRSESFITRFARIYTPIVVFAAIAVAVVPPLFSGDFVGTFSTWLYRALMFLIVSCPCALVISVPLSFFGGIGGASRKGILIKGSNYIDALSQVDTVVFDKTGTLTHGQFAVSAVHPESCDERHLLHLAAHVEHFSTHPIGAALRDAFPDEATDGCLVTDVEEVAGKGVRARVGNDLVCVGNTRMMDAVGAKWSDCDHVGTIIHVAINGDYAGHIVINDKVKDDSLTAIKLLKKLGVGRTFMLTGDRLEVAQEVA